MARKPRREGLSWLRMRRRYPSRRTAAPLWRPHPCRGRLGAWSCRLALAADRDDTVSKALSRALRQLVIWDGRAGGFLDAHDQVLAARVMREVRNKLETGRKRASSR